MRIKLFSWIGTTTLVVTALFGCGGSGDGAGGGGGGVNKPLTGAQLGDVTTPNDQLHKQLDLTTPASATDFSFGTATIMNSGNPIASFLAIPVSNVSPDTTHCTTTLNNGVIRDAMGSNIPVSIDIGTLLLGSYRQVSSQFMNSCLGPGESGYFFGAISGDVYPTIASIEFTTFLSVQDGSLPVPFEYSEDNFIAESYTVSNNSPQDISITIKNKGTATGRVGNSNYYVILDDQDVPLEINSATIQNDVLAANQTGVMIDDNYFDGASTKLIAYVSHASFNNLTALSTNVIEKSSFSSNDEFLVNSLNRDIGNTILRREEIIDFISNRITVNK